MLAERRGDLSIPHHSSIDVVVAPLHVFMEVELRREGICTHGTREDRSLVRPGPHSFRERLLIVKAAFIHSCDGDKCKAGGFHLLFFMCSLCSSLVSLSMLQYLLTSQLKLLGPYGRGHKLMFAPYIS